MKGITIIASLFITSLFIPITAEGQAFYKKPYDIGVNVTSLISKVISVGDDSKENPIGLLFRKKSDRFGFFLGMAVLVSEEDVFDNISSMQITTNNLFGKIGFEKYKTISSKFSFGYGLTFAGSTNKEATLDFGQGNTTSLSIHNISIGGGPAMRFEYKLNDLISLSTESSLVGSFTKKTTLISNGVRNDELKTNGFLLSTDIPSQLFINIHF